MKARRRMATRRMKRTKQRVLAVGLFALEYGLAPVECEAVVHGAQRIGTQSGEPDELEVDHETAARIRALAGARGLPEGEVVAAALNAGFATLHAWAEALA